MDIQSCRNMMSDFEAALDRILSEHGRWLLTKSELSGKRDDILKEYNNSRDTFFSSLFKFRYEQFHSQILRMFLDKDTPEIGNSQYLKEFVKLLGRIKPSIREHCFTDPILVECENGRIDIFIYDQDYGIILENKINGASDQPNQLARYLRLAKGLGKDILGIVYIPPLHQNTGPSLETYDEEYREYINEIKEKLVILPVWDPVSQTKDLIHGFIGSCLALPENNDKQKYILSQYMNLLISLEGETKMTAEVDMELLAECYKDRKSISIMENISEVWNNRVSLLGGLLRRSMREKLKDLGFVMEKDSADETAFFKPINGNDKIKLCFSFYTPDSEIRIGFWSDGHIRGRMEQNLLKIGEEVMPETYFPGFEDGGYPTYWFTTKFSIEEYKEPLKDIEDYLVNKCRLLEEVSGKASL